VNFTRAAVGLVMVFGSVTGTLLVTTMENYLARFDQWVTVIQSAIFFTCVLAFRRGVIGAALRLAL
jgi:ABC-type branched-subunit amino acid transport system permease subunit